MSAFRCWGDCTHTDREHDIVCIYNGWRGVHVCSNQCCEENA